MTYDGDEYNDDGYDDDDDDDQCITNDLLDEQYVAFVYDVMEDR